MNPAPVSLCLIVKDEPRLRAALEPLRPHVRQICVLDTGSSLERLKELRALEGEKVIDRLRIAGPGEFDYHGVPIDFARARNASFDLATEPWVLWMDGDDDIVGVEKIGAIIAEFEGYRPHNPGAEFEISFPYEYSYDKNGRAELVVERGRLYSRRAAWHWCWVVHESICAVPGQHSVRFSRSDVVWKHRRKESGKDGGAASLRNLRIFEKYWEHEGKTGPLDARMALYTAMTLQEMGRFDEAEDRFRAAINAYEIDEDIVVACLRYIGMLLQRDSADGQDLKKALAYAFLCARAKETWGQGWLAIATVYGAMAKKADWTHGRTLERLVYYGKMGLAEPYANWFGDPRDRLRVAIDMSIALDHLGRWPEALAVCEQGLREFPGDPTLESNRDLMAVVCDENKIVAALETAQKIRGRGGAHERAVARLAGRVVTAVGGAASTTAATSGGVASAASVPPEELLELRPDGRLRILFACGQSWQPWNPELVESSDYRGGGSEVAVVEISRRLAARGHEVIVATDCGGPKVYDGVTWVPSDYLSQPQKTDVLICWRTASHVNFPIAARLRVLWLHDVLAHGAADDNLPWFDRVVVLSRYHRDVVRGHHPSLAAERFEILRSGAPAKRFANQTLPRNAHKVVWTSSLDRGVVHLLEIWPGVRTAVPDAELHIFYGWDMWQRMGTNPMGLVHVQHLVRTLAAQGVVYRERVGSDDLAHELVTAGVWAYPCTFPEIFCVSAVEAQMAGLRVIATPAGALPETILEGAGIAGDPGSAAARTAFRDLLIEAMTDEGSVRWKPRHLIAHAAHNAFDLEPLGELWEHRFRAWLAEKTDVAPYEGALPPYVSDAVMAAR